jgi:ATP-dependent Lon protease
MTKDRKLYNLALYSLMIKMINNYLSLNTEESFNDYLLNIKDNINEEANVYKKSKLVPIATFPLDTFLNMISTFKNTKLLKNLDDLEEDDEDDHLSDPDYEPSVTDSSDDNPINIKPKVVKKNHTIKSKSQKEFIKEIFKNAGSDNDEKDIAKYYSKLTNKEQNDLYAKLVEINNYKKVDKPKLVEIMSFPIPLSQKNYIMKQYITLLNSHHPDNKLRTWVDAVLSFPFGKYKGIDLKNINSSEEVQSFLTNLETIMDSAVWGHIDAKRQIIQMMGQQIRNPDAKGNVLGIWGPPGNGKTTLIKEGIAKAMDKPFVFISLGGATDSSFLEGHSYTYEGAICGRMVEMLIESKVMNPVIFFDELDKISDSPKGNEINGLLTHLTDSSQNNVFNDKYFSGIDIDFSKALFFFSYNNIELINHILKDRLTIVKFEGYNIEEKINIVKDFIIPDLLKNIGFEKDDIKINNDVIKYILSKTDKKEDGVRTIKKNIEELLMKINLLKLTKTKNNKNEMNIDYHIEDLVFPLEVTTEISDKLLFNGT